MTKTPVTIRFQTTLYALKAYTILPVPKEESMKLPSRGQLSVSGRLNGAEFRAILEPDGKWSHWMKVDDDLKMRAGSKAGEMVDVEITTVSQWPDPILPADFAHALEDAPDKVKHKWHDITPMARWEWVRWVNATNSNETRKIRIEKTISKLNGTHRRPCCFNLAACTDPELSKNATLIEPDRTMK